MELTKSGSAVGVLHDAAEASFLTLTAATRKEARRLTLHGQKSKIGEVLACSISRRERFQKTGQPQGCSYLPRVGMDLSVSLLCDLKRPFE